MKNKYLIFILFLILFAGFFYYQKQRIKKDVQSKIQINNQQKAVLSVDDFNVFREDLAYKINLEKCYNDANIWWLR